MVTSVTPTQRNCVRRRLVTVTFAQSFYLFQYQKYGNFVMVLSVTIISATRNDPDSHQHPKVSHNETSSVRYAVFKLPPFVISVCSPTHYYRVRMDDGMFQC